MKNSKRTLCLILVSIVILLLSRGCRIPPIFDPTIVDKKPTGQPNTKWVSADESIVLYVDEDHTVTGTMKIGRENIGINVYFEKEAGTGMMIFPKKMLEEDDVITEELEYWSCWYKSKKEFVATVKTTTFLKVDQTIVFYRVDE